MNIVLWLIFLASFSFTAFCFSCDDLWQENQCHQLEGCSWNSTINNCFGIFSPSCMPPDCYYIDNSTQTVTPTGTPTDPLSTLTDGLNKLANSNGSLVIMNHRNMTLVDINSAITIKSNITIKPLITGKYYKISLNNMPSTANSTFTVSNRLTIIEAIFNYTLTRINTLFVMQNGTLYLRGVIMEVSTSSPTYYVLTTGASYSSSKFYYEGGQISNKSASFFFENGLASFKNVKVMNLTYALATVYAPATLNVENCYFRGGTLTRFFIIQSYFSIKGCVFEQGSFSLVNGVGTANITIQQTIFRDMKYNSPFISLIPQNQTDFLLTSHVIRDCLFENITTQSIIHSQRRNTQISLINVTMKNIGAILFPSTKGYLAISAGLDYELGVCCKIRLNSTLKVISSHFTNVNSTCINLDESTLSVNSSVFDNSGIRIGKSSLSAGSLESLDSVSGMTWIRINSPPSSPISIDSSKFIKNSMLSIQGGAIRLIGSRKIQLSLTSNEFIENVAYYGGAVYIDNPRARLISTNNIFTSNLAYEGGAIYIKSYSLLEKPFLPSFIIVGDNYTRNTAIRDGGAVYANGESLQISNGQFVDNTARFGGGLYAINIDPHNDTLWHISGVTFSNNVASCAGSSIFTLSNLKEDQCIFDNNTDPLNQPTLSQRPSYFLFSFYDVIIDKEIYGYDDLSAWTSNTSRTKLAFTLNTSQGLFDKPEIKHKSGREIKQIIKIEACDEQGQILRFSGEDDQILVQITEKQNSASHFQPYLKSSPLILSFKEGQILIKTYLKIFGEIDSKATLKFKSLNTTNNTLYEANFVMDQDIQISFFPCEIGDIYDDSTKSCNPCPSGTYSIDDPYQSPVCRECVDNAECLGGSKIAPLPGYWRYDTETAVVMQCLYETACKGGYVDEIYYPQGVCAPSYEGNLCSKCASNYAKFGSSEICFDCLSGLYYVKLFSFFGLYLIGIIFSFKSASKKVKKSSGTLQDKGVSEQNNANEELRFNIIKIVFSFIQMSSIIVQFRFGWPEQVSEIVEATNKIIPLGQDAFSIDCFITLLLGTDAQTHFIKLIVAAVRPFIIWMIIISGFNLYAAIQERNLKKLCAFLGTNQFVLLLIISFVDQPHIILITLETFKCQIYENSHGSIAFMLKDPQMECWTNIHIVWSTIAGLIFLIWGVILPILLFRKIQQIRNIDKSLRSKDYSQYNYIFGSMKPRWYYWEFISLLRKSLVIICFACQTLLSEATQINLILMIFWCFAGVCERFKPYRDERLNKLELCSLINLIAMTYTGAYFIDEKAPNTTMLNVLIIAMLLTNISFYLLSTYHFIASYLQKPSQTTKAGPELEMGQGAQVEKETSFISLRSPVSFSKRQTLENLLQLIEIEADEQEIKEGLVKPMFSLNSVSSEPDKEKKTNQNEIIKPEIIKTIGNVRDLEPMSPRDSKPEEMQPGYSTIVDLLTSPRSSATRREKDKAYENLFGPKRPTLTQDLRLVRNIKPLAQEIMKISIPNEHEGIQTPKYDIKTKKSRNGDEKKPPHR